MIEHSIPPEFLPDIKKAAKRVGVGLSKVLSDQYMKFSVNFERAFEDYMLRTFDRATKIKTLLNRYEPRFLYDAYVSPDLVRRKDENAIESNQEENRITEDEFHAEIKTGARLIISARAGSGKSMLMRHIFCEMVQGSKYQVPIFCELRNIKSGEEKSLLKLIQDTIAGSSKAFSAKQFAFALKSGKIALLLDGFDEIPIDLRAEVENQILSLNAKYPTIPVLLSSRPDRRFVSWSEYSEFRVSGFTESQVLELVDKIDYDQELKLEFKQQVTDRFYESHKEFLETPLLATMMLMVFDQFAEVPTKEHLFYSQAFSVLVDKHDATKVGFKRDYYTDLQTDDFRSLFATFCAFTYIDEKYSVTKREALEYCHKALRYSSFDLDGGLLLQDFEKSICVIIEDGDFFSFLHRSFQEYFAALFIISSDPSIGKKMLFQLYERHCGMNQVLLLVWDMNRDYFERHLMMDLCKECVKAIKEKKGKPKVYLGKLFVGHYLFGAKDEENGQPNDIYLYTGRSSQSDCKYFGLAQIIFSFYEEKALNPMISIGPLPEGTNTLVGFMNLVIDKEQSISSSFKKVSSKHFDAEPGAGLLELLIKKVQVFYGSLQARIQDKVSLVDEILK